MITARNFAHIHTDDQGRQVLFWVEHDGDDCHIHQVIESDIGTVDIKLTAPEEQVEGIWPEKMNFDKAAEHMKKTVYDMGIGWGEEK